jgi:hypothetical protein
VGGRLNAEARSVRVQWRSSMTCPVIRAWHATGNRVTRLPLSEGQRRGRLSTGRHLKQDIGRWLQQDDFEAALRQLLRLPARRAVNPLLSFFYSADDLVKWRAVSALGAVTAALADRDPESARVVMRRLMWSLNDESGGIGWGSPEAMGDIMARNARLAAEFGAILVSYADENGNYIEHPLLQSGVLWGVGRLAHARPPAAAPAAEFLPPYLEAPDPFIRGLALWAAAALPCPRATSHMQRLTADNAVLAIWTGDRLVDHTVGRLAAAALERTRRPL